MEESPENVTAAPGPPVPARRWRRSRPRPPGPGSRRGTTWTPNGTPASTSPSTASPTPPTPAPSGASSSSYKGSIYMVFEYMDHDLTELADRPGMRFTVPQIKCDMKQLFTGLHYCHVNQVLH